MPTNHISNSPLRTPAIALLATCSAWLITLTVFWFTTGQLALTIHVRWVPDTTNGQRGRAETELSLVLHETREPSTASYFLLNTEPPNLKRIVLHPFVEDTAFIDRGSFALEHPPQNHMWIGDQFVILQSRSLLYLSILGWVVSLAALTVPLFLRSPPRH